MTACNAPSLFAEPIGAPTPIASYVAASRRAWTGEHGAGRAPSSPPAFRRRGHGPRTTTRGTRDAAGTQVSARYARDPIPAAPRGSGRASPPVPAVFLVAMSPTCPILRRPGRRSRTRCKTPPEPARVCGHFQPFARLVVDGSAGPLGSAQNGVGAGAFPLPAGQARCLSARIRARPASVTPPGAVAAESHRRGHRPVRRPARSASGRAPRGRTGIAPGPPRTGDG